MAKNWPNIIGPEGSPKVKKLFEMFRQYIDSLDDDLGVLEGDVGTTEMDISAIETYLITGPRVFQPAAVKIGETSAADVLMQQPLIILSSGELITVAATEIDISGLDTFTAVDAGKKFRCLLTASLTDGTIDAVQGVAVDDAETPVTPDAPEGTIGFAVVEITTAASTTFGTTVLTSIATFKDVITPL